MKELLKKQYKNILTVLAYVIIAVVVYVTWFQNLWSLWYVSLLTGVIIAIIGAIIGYIYIKSIIKSENDVN